MKNYKIYLEDFCDDIFHKMEEIQDGKSGHVVEFFGEDKTEVAFKIAEKLIPFIEEQLSEVE